MPVIGVIGIFYAISLVVIAGVYLLLAADCSNDAINEHDTGDITDNQKGKKNV